MEYLDNKFKIFNKKFKDKLPEINKEVDEIINFLKTEKNNYILGRESSSLEDKKYIDKVDNKIELYLDYLMNPYISNEFNRIIKYWEPLNPESADDYKEMFNQLYE